MDELFENKYHKPYGHIIEIGYQGSEPIVIDSRHAGNCRFCGNDQSTVNFSNVAHPIPEMLGNKIVHSVTECDQCNKFFSKNYESQLANFLGINRSLLHTKGKRGIPNFKTNDDKLQISHESDKPDSNVTIAVDPDSDFVKVDPAKKKIVFTVPRNPYIPYAVYKAFIKIGYSLIFYHSALGLNSTRKFLRSKIKTEEGRFFEPLLVHYKVSEFFKDIRALIYERRDPLERNIPGFIFILSFNHLVFQTSIPSVERDNPDQKMMMIPIFQKSSMPELLDLSSTEKVEDQFDKLTYTYSETKMKDYFNNPFLKKLQ